MRLLSKGIPTLLEEILYAIVGAEHLQSVRPMAFMQRTEAESVLRKDKCFDFLCCVACDYNRLSCFEHCPNHPCIRFFFLTP